MYLFSYDGGIQRSISFGQNGQLGRRTFWQDVERGQGGIAYTHTV